MERGASRRLCLSAAWGAAVLCLPSGVPAQEISIREVAAWGDAIPGGSGPFRQIGRPSYDGDAIVFNAGNHPREEGVFVEVGGALEVVADLRTEDPDGGGLFLGFLDRPMALGGDALFFGRTMDGLRLYLGSPSSIARVAEVEGAEIPGTMEPFTRLTPVLTRAGRILFQGEGAGLEGIYALRDGILERIVDNETPAPGRLGPFGSPTLLAAQGDQILFFDGELGSRALYTAGPDGIELAVDTSKSIPGGVGTFDALGETPSGILGVASGLHGPAASLDGGAVAFRGRGPPRRHPLDPGQDGIYLLSRSRLHRVADLGTEVPGGGFFTGFGSTALKNGAVVFLAEFIDAEAADAEGLFIDFGAGPLLIVRTGQELEGGKSVTDLSLPADALQGEELVFRAELFDPRGTAILAATVPTRDVDFDADGIARDNCPHTPNPDQTDTDGDLLGDLCDAFPLDADHLAAALRRNESLGASLDRCEEDLGLCLGEPRFLDGDGDGEDDRTDRCPGTPLAHAVDDAGCSLEQFCSGTDERECLHADWQNDEPRGLSRDCVRREGRCAARECGSERGSGPRDACPPGAREGRHEDGSR